MKKLLSALLAAGMLFSIAPAALADDNTVDYDDSLTLQFDFTVETKDGYTARRSDLDITVTSSSFLEAYERNVTLNGDTLSMDVIVNPGEIQASREKKGFVRVAVKAPSRNYYSISSQSQPVTVIYPEMDLDNFEDTLYDMREYGDKEETYSPDTLMLPAKAITLMKKYLKSDYTMTLEYDDYSLVFTGRNIKTMSAKAINTSVKEDPSSSLSSLLSANKISEKKLTIVNFSSNAALGGTVGIQVNTGSKSNYVYQYNEAARKLVPVEATTTYGDALFFVNKLGEFVISSTPLDSSMLTTAEKAEAAEEAVAPSEGKLFLSGTKPKTETKTSGTLVLSGISSAEKGKDAPVVSGKLTLK